MVIPSLIHRELHEVGPITGWRDGSAVRDFIHVGDVASEMMQCIEQGINQPINLGSGGGVTIKELAETVANLTDKEIIWDTDKPSGDKLRIMDTSRAESYGIKVCTLKAEWIFIAGSSSGSGSELAKIYARKGFNIILHGSDANNLNKVHSDINGIGRLCEVVQGDLCDEKCPRNLVSKFKQIGCPHFDK